MSNEVKGKGGYCSSIRTLQMKPVAPLKTFFYGFTFEECSSFPYIDGHRWCSSLSSPNA